MKTVIIFLITIYQQLFSPLLKQLLGVKVQCRYSPTCSEYTKQKVSQDGVVKGLLAGAMRISHCQPFGKAYGYR